MTLPDLAELARHVPPPSPIPVWFQEWEHWRQGLRKTRPAAAPKRIPAWAWVKLAADAKPKPPPPAAPVAEVWWPNAPWHKRVLYTTWGFTSGQFTPEQLAAKAAVKYRGGIAIEGFPADATSTDGHDNTPHVAPLRDACHAAGIPFSLWNRTDQMTVDQVLTQITDWKPDAYLADVEVDWGRAENTTIPAAVAKEFPKLPRAVIIAGMPDAQYVKPWIDAKFDCCTQAYWRADGQVVGGTDRDAYWRGWPPWKVIDASKPMEEGALHTFPCLEAGAEGAPHLRDQLSTVAAWGEAWGVYAAELMTDDDWSI
jgi:hypothetical protein